MTYIKLDVNLLSFVILLITYLNSSRYQKNSNNYLKYLKSTTFCILTILFIDIFVNIFESMLINYVFVNITFLLITINGFLTPLASYLWTMFLRYYLTPNNKNNDRNILITSIPFLLNLGLMIFNIFSPFFFSITVESGYVREKYFILFSLFSAFYIIIASILLIKHRKDLNKYEFWILFSFGTFPILGGLLQSLFYGALFTYPLSALSLTLVYIYLRKDISVLDYVSKAYNSHYFNNFCNKFIIQNQKKDYTLCYIDIDNLDEINNTFGYKQGDNLLAKFVEIVNRCIGKNDYIFSAESDEFIIYLNTSNKEEVIRILKIIYRNISYYNKISKKPYNINYTYVYYINTSKTSSPFRILKTLYTNLCRKKENKNITNNYKSYEKEMS